MKRKGCPKILSRMNKNKREREKDCNVLLLTTTSPVLHVVRGFLCVVEDFKLKDLLIYIFCYLIENKFYEVLKISQDEISCVTTWPPEI